MLLKEIIQDITSLGGTSVYIFVMILTFILKEWQLFIRLSIGILLLGIILIIARSIYFKQRPNKKKYKGKFQKLLSNSFISGHALMTTILALIISTFLNNFLVAILMAITILIVGYTRVKLKMHYWSDVIMGWILGFIVGLVSISII